MSLLWNGTHVADWQVSIGGENTLQGHGARGGADRVEELGDPGILLELSKAGCA